MIFSLTDKRERGITMKIRLLCAVLGVLVSTPAYATRIHLVGIGIHVPEANGVIHHFPAPDGSRIIIKYNGDEYPCVIELGECVVELPTNDPLPLWSIARTEVLIGAGFIANVEPSPPAKSAFRRLIDKLVGN